MDATEVITRQLAEGPNLLRDLLSEIPRKLHKIRRLEDKWSIHENACHLADVEALMYDRLLTFKNVDYPVFQPFIPGVTFSDKHLLYVDLDESLERFSELRRKTVALACSFDEKDWEKEATHPEYDRYTAKILLRHMLMHDNLHQYRIQQLWLMKQTFLATQY